MDGGERIYGTPFLMPPGIDFVTYSNEDIGLTSSLVNGTNDNYQFDLPYPASFNEYEESMVIWKLQFIMNEPQYPHDDAGAGLLVHLSMLDKDVTAAWTGELTDSEDEWFKSQFAGPMFFGVTASWRSDVITAGQQAQVFPHGHVVTAVYYPEAPLDLIYPLRVTLTNQAATIDPDTGDEAVTDFTGVEKVAIRAWYTKRRLTRSERSAIQMQARWARLES